MSERRRQFHNDSIASDPDAWLNSIVDYLDKLDSLKHFEQIQLTRNLDKALRWGAGCLAYADWISHGSKLPDDREPEFETAAAKAILPWLELVPGYLDDPILDADQIEVLRELRFQAIRVTKDRIKVLREPQGNSVVLEGDEWRITFEGMSIALKSKGNLAVGWVVLLLSRPGKALFPWDFRGDPDGKLKADATQRAEPETDREGGKRIQNRLDDIDVIEEAVPLTQSLENERARLMLQLKKAVRKTKIPAAVSTDHHAISALIRIFLKGKLRENLPRLSEHLLASLTFANPTIVYNPAPGTSSWNIQET
jgi:hypothetical protein